MSVRKGIPATLFGESPDAALVIDPDLHIGYANRAATELLGRSVEDLSGDSFGEPLAVFQSP